MTNAVFLLAVYSAVGCVVGCTAICCGLAQVDEIVTHALDHSLSHMGSDADTPWLLSCLARCMFVSEKEVKKELSYTLASDRRIDTTFAQCYYRHSFKQPAQPVVPPHTSNSQFVSHEHQPATQLATNATIGRGIAENEPPECRLHELTARNILPSAENEAPQTFRRMRQGSRQRMRQRRF